MFDCFGAGQKVSQGTFLGRDWRQAPESAKRMFDVFPIMRQLHELLWYLTEALTLQPARSIHSEIRHALAETERLTHLEAESVMKLDIASHREGVNQLLLRTSELVRAEALRNLPAGRRKSFSRGAIGAKLRGADLTETLFPTQAQLNAAKGDAGTKIPPSFTRPAHWQE